MVSTPRILVIGPRLARGGQILKNILKSYFGKINLIV
jgi:hypothetical protein